MAVSERRRSRNWRFADAGSRFDNNPRVAARDQRPISPTFTRKIVRCRRCGSRIISNARRCPYCSKSVVPFYRSFAFWLFIVGVLAVATIYFVFYFNPVSAPPVASGANQPIRVGAPDSESTVKMPVGSTVDCSDLLITVISARQSHVSNDGRLIYEFTVQFYNKSTSRVSLLSTQWLMRTADGALQECYIGKTIDGVSLSSGVEGRQLSAGEVLTTKIYFAGEYPDSLVYLINPLETESSQNISWDLSFLATLESEPSEPVVE